MLFIAELEYSDYYGRRDRVVLIEADSKSHAEVKLHKHFDVPLYRTQENGDFINVGGNDDEVTIIDFEITECIR